MSHDDGKPTSGEKESRHELAAHSFVRWRSGLQEFVEIQMETITYVVNSISALPSERWQAAVYYKGQKQATASRRYGLYSALTIS
jgi:hypothetical protein